jgi:hypothetical protein
MVDDVLHAAVGLEHLDHVGTPIARGSHARITRLNSARTFDRLHGHTALAMARVAPLPQDP